VKVKIKDCSFESRSSEKNLVRNLKCHLTRELIHSNYFQAVVKHFHCLHKSMKRPSRIWIYMCMCACN